MTDEDLTEDRLDDLDDLIRYLEKEQNRLKKCVEDAAKEWDFSQAKAFAKAHGHIAGRLRTLKNLRDPAFDQRAFHHRRLMLLEEQLRIHAYFPQIIRHLTGEREEIKSALDRLDNTEYTLIDTQHIDDALFSLIDGAIDGFKLHLNRNEKLVFDFVCRNKLLLIGFSYRKGSLLQSIKKRLRKIGFSKVDGSRKFVRGVDVSNFRDAWEIKQLLAVVVFDVLGRSWFDNPAELEIIYKE